MQTLWTEVSCDGKITRVAVPFIPVMSVTLLSVSEFDVYFGRSFKPGHSLVNFKWINNWLCLFPSTLFAFTWPNHDVGSPNNLVSQQRAACIMWRPQSVPWCYHGNGLHFTRGLLNRSAIVWSTTLKISFYFHTVNFGLHCTFLREITFRVNY